MVKNRTLVAAPEDSSTILAFFMAEPAIFEDSSTILAFFVAGKGRRGKVEAPVKAG